jgi:hypothetical protein
MCLDVCIAKRFPTPCVFLNIPNHPGDMPEGTLRAILKQAGLSPEQLLDA